MDSHIFFAECQDIYILKIDGPFHFNHCPAVDAFIKKIFTEKPLPIIIDMSGTHAVDSTAIGTLARIATLSKRIIAQRPVILGARGDVLTIINSMCLDRVFALMEGDGLAAEGFEEIPYSTADRAETLDHIIASHRTLISLSADNRVRFEEAVKALENERKSLNAGA